MPIINKNTIKTFKSYPTLKIFKFNTSQVYHFVMYVGTHLKEIDKRKVLNGNFGHSLKTKVIREAEQQAKKYSKNFDAIIK